MVKLSIITINRNNAEGLRRTLASVASQTYRDIEHIVIDGASTDDSVAVIREYESTNNSSSHPLTVTWISEPDSGIYNAMNKGTLMATGEYCLYLNSGDYLYSSTIISEVLSGEYNAQFIWGQVLISDDSGKQYRAGLDNTDFTEFKLFLSAPPHQGSFINRELLLKVGMYDERYTLVADLKCIYRCLMLEKATFAYTGKIISVMEAGGVSYQQREKCIEQDDNIFREFYTETLLKDYHDWLRLQDEVRELNKTIEKYRNAITIYEKARKNIFTRRLHSWIYKLVK